MVGRNFSGYGQHFLAEICREHHAVQRILRQLYPDGPKCASCRAEITGKRALASFWRGDRSYCASCNSKFAPRAGTILADSKLSYSQFEILLVGFSLGVDHHQLASIVGIHVETVGAWASKVKFWESHV